MDQPDAFFPPEVKELVRREQLLSQHRWRRIPMYLAVFPGGPLVVAGVLWLVSSFVQDLRTIDSEFTWAMVLVGPLVVCFATIRLIDAYKRRKRRRDIKLKPVPVASPRLGAPTRRGSVEWIRDAVPSFVSSRRCLAVRLVLADATDDELYLQRSRAADFLVVPDGQAGGDPQELLVVSGTVMLQGPSTKLADEDEVARIQVQSCPGFGFPGPTTAEETQLQEGDRVEVSGHGQRERVLGLAHGYRDFGEVLVLRGRPGHPVIVRVISDE